MMKRLLAIFFLFTFLSANTAFGEVLKLPVLIHHYVEHEELEHKVSFIDFLKEHYSNLAQHDDYAHHHHDNLPFKSTIGHGSNVITIIPPLSLKLERIEFASDKIKILVHRNEHFDNNYLSKIWQPPRQG